MIVCSCNVLSDHAIREACARQDDAPRTPGQVHRCFGCSAQCGRCTRTIKSILQQAQACAADCSTCPAALANERAFALLNETLPVLKESA
jgi:bacterioferritin-associated ferredoxin